MKILISALIAFSAIALHSQVPQFQKYPVDATGCTVVMPGDPEIEMTWSEDSSKVYTGEATFGNFKYAVICVELKDTLDTNKDENQDFLESYLDFLQDQFEITSAFGYGEGHTMESNPNAIGVIDFWEDGDGNKWSVKGWIDNHYIAVLCIYGPEEVNYNFSEIFLNGFRFPSY